MMTSNVQRKEAVSTIDSNSPSTSSTADQKWISVVPSTLGPMAVASSQLGICRLTWEPLEALAQPTFEDAIRLSNPQAISDPDQARHWQWVHLVQERIQDPWNSKDVPVDLRGTDFQQKVWNRLLQIPCGERLNYAQLAAAIGHPNSVRAVANACGANPVPVLVPCHRVVASGGGLGGFSAGLPRKVRLLAAEDRQARLFEFDTESNQ